LNRQPQMNLAARIKHELKAVGMATLYFGVWLGALLAIKALVLAEYRIEFNQWSLALVGALILSKVVLVLEHVPLGAWVRAQPVWVEVVLRTALYAVGVAIVLALERAFEGRNEHGGFIAALIAGFREADIFHVLANTICLSGALLGYNMLAVIRRHLGEGGLLRLFLKREPASK
jgi:hypothetical protein